MRSHIEFGVPVDYEVQQQVKLLFISCSTHSVDEGLVINFSYLLIDKM